MLPPVSHRKEPSYVKANELIRAGHSLTLGESKLMAIVLTEIAGRQRQVDGSHLTVDVTKDLYIEMLHRAGSQVQTDSHYKQLVRAARGLFNKRIEYTENDVEISLRWVQRVRYRSADSTVSVQLATDIANYVYELRGDFSKMQLMTTLSFKRKHSPMLYEWIKTWQHKDGIHLSETELRKALGCQNSHKSKQSFLAYVIAPSLAEVEAVTGMNITRSSRRSGDDRMWTFVIHKKEGKTG